MAQSFVFSSESVGEGHPDKVADLISDSVLDACLSVDRSSRVACETFVKSNVVVVGGETNGYWQMMGANHRITVDIDKWR